MAQTQSEALRQLLEVGRLLSSKLDLGDLLRTVLEAASKVVDAETASLLLVDEKTQALYFALALHMGEGAHKVRLKLGQGIAGSVAQSLKPEIINEAKKDPRWSPAMDKQSGFVTRSILAVPLTIKGRLIGVVEAINKRAGEFSEDDLRSFEAFASQAAVAIDNARLFASVREEKAKLDTIFGEMNDGAILADSRGRIIIANGAAHKLLGVGHNPTTLQDALSGLVITPSMHEMLAGDKPDYKFAAAREEPKKLILAGKVTRLLSKGSERHDAGRDGWIVVFRDETEEWQKEKLKRTFLSLISHKLKTPLSAVIGFSEILLEDLKAGITPTASTLKAAHSISFQGRKLGDLVDRLLRYTTLENTNDAIDRKPCSVDELIGETLKLMKDWLAEKNATVAFGGAPGESLLIDREQMVEVIKTLVENAVKFDTKAEKKVAIALAARDGWAHLSVRDTGPGIPPEDQDKVFTRFHQIETFFTGQVDGWGLGLSYVKKIVEGHGGLVELQSKLGEGTTVTLKLPLAAGK